MASITPITNPAAHVTHDVLSSPDHIARLQDQLHAVLYTDSTGQLLAVTVH